MKTLKRSQTPYISIIAEGRLCSCIINLYFNCFNLCFSFTTAGTMHICIMCSLIYTINFFYSSGNAQLLQAFVMSAVESTLAASFEIQTVIYSEKVSSRHVNILSRNLLILPLFKTVQKIVPTVNLATLPES